ncbi:HAD hydrolase family protein, partial [Salmonella enterica subsp. enterica serovar Anatum]|nr:HAD hydrolase family protein [Salmonella enterica subsp. enterica serovar Anatum]
GDQENDIAMIEYAGMGVAMDTLLNRARLFGGQHLATAQKAMDRLLAV